MKGWRPGPLDDGGVSRTIIALSGLAAQAAKPTNATIAGPEAGNDSPARCQEKREKDFELKPQWTQAHGH